MNKRGQGTLIILMFVFIIIGASWFAFIGEYFSLVGQTAIEGGATGGWAFFITHLNIWFWIVFFLALAGGSYVGGGQ